MVDLADFKARLPILPIVRRFVRLQRAGPIWKGLCPFHQEKTPSFTVTEARGTYHCFGCQAHGNGIDFLIAVEGLDFPEAIERAAELTGLEPPTKARPDPERARAVGLTDLLEDAARWFRQRLLDPEARRARDYLRGRGLEPATVERFELGLAPDARERLTRTLLAQGASLADLEAAGLTARPDEGGAPFDRFRDRLMFPIRDRRGRLVGFGGRALGDGAKAKYVNSAEGPLFKKRELLYGADKLTRATGHGRLHVVEGYIDVIAMVQAGLAAVAPLGTAITAEQLRQLWRLADVPLVCLDGDAAGQRAAGRLAELAFGELEAGRSLGFALLPEGEDPDSLLRRHGRAGFARATEQEQSLGRTLLRHVGAETPGLGPEARAEIRKRLRDLVRAIPDGDVRVEYEREFAPFLANGTDLDPRPAERRRPGYDPSRRLGRLAPEAVRREREIMAVCALLEEPGLIEPAAPFLERVQFVHADCQVVVDALMDVLIHGQSPSAPAVEAALTASGAVAERARVAAEGRRLARRFPLRAIAAEFLGLARDETGPAAATSLAGREAERARAEGSPAAAAFEALHDLQRDRNEE